MADVVKAVRRELVLTLDRWKSKMCAGELAEVILASPELRARLSQAGAGGVVVKPLEWREEFRDGTFVKLTALTPFGGYEASSEFTALTNKGPMTALPRWKGPLDSSSHEATSLDQAKAAAQADYSARILAALAPSPSAGEPAGWKLVPVEPDARMHAAGSSVLAAGQGQVWRAMLDHAPSPPAPVSAPATDGEVKLRAALQLAKDMFIANGLSLPHTMEVIDAALSNPAPGHGEAER